MEDGRNNSFGAGGKTQINPRSSGSRERSAMAWNSRFYATHIPGPMAVGIPVFLFALAVFSRTIGIGAFAPLWSVLRATWIVLRMVVDLLTASAGTAGGWFWAFVLSLSWPLFTAYGRVCSAGISGRKEMHLRAREVMRVRGRIIRRHHQIGHVRPPILHPNLRRAGEVKERMHHRNVKHQVCASSRGAISR